MAQIDLVMPTHLPTPYPSPPVHETEYDKITFFTINIVKTNLHQENWQ